MSGERLPQRQTAAEYRLQQFGLMGEDAFQGHVIRMATSLGWEHFHVYNSRRSRAGYPDLHLWHPRMKLAMMRELKTMKGKVSADQREVMASMQAAGIDVGVWRPADIDGRIIQELKGQA